MASTDLATQAANDTNSADDRTSLQSEFDELAKEITNIFNNTKYAGEALFTGTQRKVLGLLYGKPQQSFYANEIARYAQVGKGSLMRELERLQQVGILTMSRQGNQTHYQANPQCIA